MFNLPSPCRREAVQFVAIRLHLGKNMELGLCDTFRSFSLHIILGTARVKDTRGSSAS